MLKVINKVSESYKNYLKTHFFFKDRNLRKSFEAELDSWNLIKGPYLEGRPVYKVGSDLCTILNEFFPGRYDFLQRLSNSLIGERKLYKHQENSIKHILAGQAKNFLLSAGTGSGKTESFLLPIIAELLKEHFNGTLNGGVRALILYPMNALANDQRERIGSYLEQLAKANLDFKFTFGRYTGETPEDIKDAYRNGKKAHENRLAGELVFRSEMRESPPNILLTNYSMLEYLLLRPDDSPFFDGTKANSWKFIVLDEAHLYKGAKGLEMSMLLARLKERIRRNNPEIKFNCIATSATIVGGLDKTKEAANFATNLFGERFELTDIIYGEKEKNKQQGSKKLKVSDYAELSRRLNEQPDEISGIELWNALSEDERSLELLNLLSEKQLPFEEVAKKIFPEIEGNHSLTTLETLIGLLVKAKNKNGIPLSSMRLHLFIRALEGAFFEADPIERIRLARGSDLEGVAQFEVALCKECGQHFFVGQKVKLKKQGNCFKLNEPNRDENSQDFGATFFRVLTDDSCEEAEERPLILCLKCGLVNENYSGCEHNLEYKRRVTIEETPKDRLDQVKRCGACGYSGGGKNPVRELVHGSDGPHAVIATAMFQALPQDRKKILAFADSRQQAAFFAWYLEDSYKSIQQRNLLFQAIKDSEGKVEFSLTSLKDRITAKIINSGAASENSDIDEISVLAWEMIYRELIGEETRNSLEGVGLAFWKFLLPKSFDETIKAWATKTKMAENAISELIRFSFQSLRQQKAIKLFTDSTQTIFEENLGLKGRMNELILGSPRSKKGERNAEIVSWDGKRSARFNFIKNIFQIYCQEFNAEELAKDFLRDIFATAQKHDETANINRDQCFFNEKNGVLLNPYWFRLVLINEKDTVFECERCSQLHFNNLLKVCQRHGCLGKLQPVYQEKLPPNHYRSLFQMDLPVRFNIEEHTAQLSSEKATEFQKDFQNGKINLLSCSTTFELGVDLGDLDAVFLRNVPPETANYIQRVGRAGRRSGMPGLAVTFCKRGSHDIFFFNSPEKIMAGEVSVPVLKILNDKLAIRHATAVILAEFFREIPEAFKTIESLIENTKPGFRKSLIEYLNKNAQKLEQFLQKIFPNEVKEKAGFENNYWFGKISDENSRICIVEEELKSDLENLEDVIQNASVNRDFKRAAWAENRRKTILKESLISFLSRKVVIPKYGFPVDVVELDTSLCENSDKVCLQRDLSIAISEFAPTSQLMANKNIWTSSGIKKVLEKEWPRKNYKFCKEDAIFLIWGNGENEPIMPCEHKIRTGKYIIPQFGFIAKEEQKSVKGSRPSRAFSLRPFYAGSTRNELEKRFYHSNGISIPLEFDEAGTMVVLCEGKKGTGFLICQNCGVGFSKPVTNHKKPSGKDCNGTLSRVSLGHEFVTNILKISLPAFINDIPLSDMGILHSVLYAFIEGAANLLDVPSGDLNGTVTGANGKYFLVIFDNVPGGAGIVEFISHPENFRKVLINAAHRVSGICGCGNDTSCYGCLRTFRNQFIHNQLNRGATKKIIEALI